MCTQETDTSRSWRIGFNLHLNKCRALPVLREESDTNTMSVMYRPCFLYMDWLPEQRWPSIPVIASVRGVVAIFSCYPQRGDHTHRSVSTFYSPWFCTNNTIPPKRFCTCEQATVKTAKPLQAQAFEITTTPPHEWQNRKSSPSRESWQVKLPGS